MCFLEKVPEVRLHPTFPLPERFPVGPVCGNLTSKGSAKPGNEMISTAGHPRGWLGDDSQDYKLTGLGDPAPVSPAGGAKGREAAWGEPWHPACESFVGA